MNIYLIRHGETDWNKQLRIQGREDIELNENGILQADKCGQAFKDVPIDLVVSSPLKRARKTAEIIAAYVGIKDIFTEDDLVERDFGTLSGLTLDEMDKLRKEGKDGEAEKFEDLSRRVKLVLDKYSKLEKYKNIIMVSHGAAINSLLAVLSNYAIGTHKTRLKNACINIIECSNDSMKIKKYNLSSDEFLEYYNMVYSV